jgi:cytochrome c oxidase subunit 3
MTEASATLHEPFESKVRQRETVIFGLWIFLTSELLLFAGFFMGFAAYRHAHPSAFVEAARHTNLVFGAINTVLLLTSSLCMSVGSRALEVRQARLAEFTVWATIALGLAFMVTKGFEYREDIQEHLWPGATFALADPAARIFWGFYWTMTVVHLCHLTVGLGLMGRLAWFARRDELSANTDAMEASSLYWHLVDVVWIVVFTTIYLVCR